MTSSAYAAGVVDQPEQPRGAARRRRRATGPPGAVAVTEPLVELDPGRGEDPAADDERLRQDVPPHHDRGV